MRLHEFDYVKEDGEKTHRKVLVLHSTKEYEDALDFGKLTETEQQTVKNIQRFYESKMKSFSDKAFRRFSKTRMQNLQEDAK
jgi:hypothetical protein